MSDSPPIADVQLDSHGLFPWRYFVRALGAVFQLRVWVVAAVAVVVTDAGDMALNALTGDEVAIYRPAMLPTDAQQFGWKALMGPVHYWQAAVAPFWHMFGTPTHALFGLWRLAVALFAGGAIARAIVFRLAYREPPGAGSVVRRSAGRLLPSLATLGGLIVLIGLLLLPLGLHAWMMHVPGLSVLSATLLPIPLLFALAAAALAVCGALGWPLLVVASAVQRPDPFDAASRALAYATQRPAQLAAYLLVALLVAAPVGAGLMVIAGLGLATSGAVLASAMQQSSELASHFTELWTTGFFNLLPLAFFCAYFWAAVAAIYLLLRRDIDGEQVDELEEDAS